MAFCVVLSRRSVETIGEGSTCRWSRFSAGNVVESEVGVLQRVLVHRPGRELDWVVPDDLGELLFDEVPWLQAVQREHDQFTAVMRDHGVEVCYLGQLLAEALVDPVTRHELTRAALDRAVLGEALYEAVVDYLDGLSSGELAERLTTGVARGKIAQLPRTLVTCSGPDLAFVVNPLPNQQFVRDSGTWIGRGLASISWLSRLGYGRPTRSGQSCGCWVDGSCGLRGRHRRRWKAVMCWW